MSVVLETLRSDRHMMALQIQAALTDAQDAIDCDNDAGIIAACQNMQKMTIDLVSSTVLDIRNRGD